jgi:predicted ATPase
VAQAVLSALGGEITLTLAEIAMDRIEALSPKERLQALLADRQLMLILDNCEHVLDAVAELVDHLLSAAPRVRVLATSREPLALTGETLCPVASLALPPDPAESTQPTAYRPLSAVERSSASRRAEALEVAEPTLVPSTLDAQSPSANGSAAAIPSAPSPSSALEYPAVRLLVERALAVRPGFQLTAASVTPVIRICRALDGIPLAIELAAARLRSLSAQQVADRLDDRFRLLSSGSRTALPRHQTLRAIVDWSWELLSPAERTMLARLAVFAGGAPPTPRTARRCTCCSAVRPAEPG